MELSGRDFRVMVLYAVWRVYIKRSRSENASNIPAGMIRRESSSFSSLVNTGEVNIGTVNIGTVNIGEVNMCHCNLPITSARVTFTENASSAVNELRCASLFVVVVVLFFPSRVWWESLANESFVCVCVCVADFNDGYWQLYLDSFCRKRVLVVWHFYRIPLPMWHLYIYIVTGRSTEPKSFERPVHSIFHLIVSVSHPVFD